MIKKLKGKKDDNKVSKQDVRIKCAFKQKYNDTILFLNILLLKKNLV